MIVSVQDKPCVVLGSVRPARTALTRMRGLLGAAWLKPGEGLWIEPCNNVHMFGMSQAITAIYVAADGTVLQVARLKPWTIGPLVLKARSVLEVSDAEERIAAGDRLVCSGEAIR